MEYNYRCFNNQTPPNPNPPYIRPPPNYFYLSEQAPLGSNYYTSNIGNPVIRNPMEVQREAMIRRQIEKDRIREEIIAAEIAGRRELEAEVRRELMLERQLEFQRIAADKLPFRRAQPPLHHQRQEVTDGGSSEKRIGTSLEERVARTGFGGFEEDLPLQRPRISEIDGGDLKEGDKVIFKAIETILGTTLFMIFIMSNIEIFF